MNPNLPEFTLRKATLADLFDINEIILAAIRKRKEEGSDQWQNGYPNKFTIEADIQKNVGWVLCQNQEIVAYMALIFDEEVAYHSIEGQWLSNQPYACIHRLAVKQKEGLKGVATYFMKEIEHICHSKEIQSIKLDTHEDNSAMLYLLKKLGYHYCGKVTYKDYKREAFEKILV